MNNIGKLVGKKAAKATARHSWHGLSSKARRQPMRSATLLGAGGVVGGLAGWFIGPRNHG
jgi:hypothetical protein